MADENRASENAPDAAQPTRVRVLVVDDSAVSRAFVAAVLEQIPTAELVTAENGAQAIRAVAEGDISMVICDYEMPDLNGLTLLRFLRKSYSPVQLPLLMLTSNEDPEVKVTAFRYGANDYIGKQAAPEELLARVGTQIALLQAHNRLNDERLRRAERQKFEAIGHLAEGLAHELNTPAQYIQDNLSFLAESFEALGSVVAELRQLPSAAERSLVQTVLDRIEYDYLAREIPRCIGESKQGIEQVARVVAVMREFARPGLPERNLHSLNEIIRGALAVTRGQWHQVADLELVLSDSLPTVRCIGVAIKQVVLYALLNAVKAMARPPHVGDRTKGQLRVRTEFDRPSWVLIEIEDNGSGMADATLQRVMDPVLSSMATEDTGEALAHARSVVVEQHQGRFEIRTSREGTTLSIRLPVEVRVVAPAEPESEDESAWG